MFIRPLKEDLHPVPPFHFCLHISFCVCSILSVKLFSTSELKYSAARLKVTLSKAISMGLNILGAQKKIIKWMKLILWYLVDYLLVCCLHRDFCKYIFLIICITGVSKVSGRFGFLCADRKMHFLPCHCQHWQ